MVLTRLSIYFLSSGGCALLIVNVFGLSGYPGRSSESRGKRVRISSIKTKTFGGQKVNSIHYVLNIERIITDSDLVPLYNSI